MPVIDHVRIIFDGLVEDKVDQMANVLLILFIMLNNKRLHLPLHATTMKLKVNQIICQRSLYDTWKWSDQCNVLKTDNL